MEARTPRTKHVTPQRVGKHRIKLADAIAAGLAALGWVGGWELRKRRGKIELDVASKSPDDNLTGNSEKP